MTYGWPVVCPSSAARRMAMRSTRAHATLGTLGAAVMLGYLTLDLGRPVEAASTDRVKRGEYLVNAMGCHDCHTPKKMGPNGPEFDMSRALSGHPEGSPLPPPPKLSDGTWVAATTWDLTAWSGPWGVSYPFNLTPDENTGLGIWTEEMFVKTMRT